MPYTQDLLKMWQRVIENFGDSMPRATIENLFYDIVVESFDGKVAVLSMHSEYRHSLIIKKYLEKIRSLISEQVGRQISLVFKYSGSSRYYIDQLRLEYSLLGGEPAVRVDPQKSLSEENKEEHARPVSTLPPCNQEYTFNNFIVGNSNKFAHAACVAVAERPATDYNPLFVYGQSGLGKTHLLYAITNELTKKKPDIKIIYTKSEDFTNYLVECLKDRAMDRFRQKFRNCDVLLIDDIQFIAGKDSTQEEFFHTFNALYEEHKQIILTSDRPPSDIKTLEYRLKTRFEWGLIADIQPPELELRLAIIKKKSEQAGVKVPDDVCEFLAENLRTNIRQLEGSIKKLRALSFLTGTDITMEMARGCVSELLGGAEPVSVTVDKIFTMVHKKYGIPKEDIIGSRRTKEIAFARHVTSYLIRNITEMSLPNIGKLLGRDHSTIISSINTIEKKLRSDAIFNVEIDQMIKEVNGK
jgi:chromosomal replication initiator protein